MLNFIKRLCRQKPIIDTTKITTHETILEDMDRTRKIARTTIEEHLCLRGFPYSRSFRKNATVEG